jgi:hypothetical protein
MKKEQLIKKLQSLPDGTNLVIGDYRKNLGGDNGDGSSEGFYSEFGVECITGRMLGHKQKPFAILSFTNEDYNNDGEFCNERIHDSFRDKIDQARNEIIGLHRHTAAVAKEDYVLGANDVLNRLEEILK